MRASRVSPIVIAATTLLSACGGSSTHLNTTGSGGASTTTGGSGGASQTITGGTGGASQTATGGATPTGGSGGGNSTPIDGSASPTIVKLELGWANSADAGATYRTATVTPDGNMTCYTYAANGLRQNGQTTQPDAEVQSLLARSDVDTSLATPCTLNWADIDPPVSTTFSDGSVVKHLVFDSCATPALTQLTAAIHRVCNAMLSDSSPADGGADAAIDTAGCSCNGAITTWDCFCSVYDCTKTLDAYSPTGGAGANYGAWVEYANCHFVVVEDLYSPRIFREVFDSTTGKLVGKAEGKLFGMSCPFGSVDAGLTLLSAGTFPGSSCVRSKCVEGHGLDGCMPGIDAGGTKG